MSSEQHYGFLLRITFVIHIIIGFVFGLGFLVVPDQLLPIFGITFTDPTIRAFGAMILALTIGSILALATCRHWTRVKLLVEIELIWTLLGAIILGYHMIVPPLYNIFMAGPIAILLTLFILFLFSYLVEIRKRPLPQV